MTVNREIVSILAALIMALAVMSMTAGKVHADETMTWSELKTNLEAGGTVTMTNDITRDSSEDITISSDATLDLNGFTLDGAGETYRNQPIFTINESPGKLTIKDDSQEKKGTVQNVWGANLIEVYGGECTLKSGTLKGSVLVDDTGSFTMTGGTISGEEYTSVLHTFKGKVTMTGGVIDGGGSDCGINCENGSLIMKGGEIKECDTGVHLGGPFATPSFTMTGGIITECRVGVETSEDGIITIGGNAVIAGNTEKDLWLVNTTGIWSRPQINIGDDLSQEASVGIWVEVMPEGLPERTLVVLAEGSKLNQYEKLMFFSDIDGYSVRIHDNELQLFKTESNYPKSNLLRVKGKTAIVKYSKLKKKSQTLKASRVIKTLKEGQGKLSYKYVSAKKGKKSFKKYFKINKKNGTVTVKKGLKKGTYKVTVKVKAAGNKKYKASSWKKVTFRIRVK